VNEKDTTGSTALVLAAIEGNTDIVDMLLKHPDISVNEKNGIGNSALHYASAR
jgi:ankyrin repeat protein